MTAKLPETIYAWPSDVTPLCGSWAQTRYPEDAEPFTRRDAPELVALVGAAKGLLFAHDHGNGLEGWHITRERLRAALAAWEKINDR